MMFKDVPVQFWIIVAVLAAAVGPASYVLRYMRDAPSKRDITLAPADLSWHTKGQLARNLFLLSALILFGVFIFTPTAETLAKSPSFWPLVILAGGVWALSTVPKAFVDGRIQPFIRGVHRSFDRVDEPKRFWGSVVWNMAIAGAFLWFGYAAWNDAPLRGMRDQCFNYKDRFAPEDALTACNKLLLDKSRQNSEADLLMARGSAYFGMKDFRKAQADYWKSARLDPDGSAIWYNLALVYERLDEREQAVTYYDRAIARNASNDEAYLNRGLIYIDTGKYGLAIADFSHAAEIKPKDPTPIANRGIAYFWNKDYARARQDFRAVEAMDPNHVVLLRGRALLSLQENDLKRAIGYLTQAIQRNRSDTWSLALRGDIYERLEEYEKSQADTEQILKINRQ